MNKTVLKRITNLSVKLDAAQSADLGVETTAVPVALDAEIVSNACEGFLLRYRAADGSFDRTSSHRSVVEAEHAAQAEFGIRHEEWQLGALPTAPARKLDGGSAIPRRS